MMFRKKKYSKKGISVVLSYVILISFSLFFAAGIYSLLKLVGNTRPLEECGENTLMLVEEVSCCKIYTLEGGTTVPKPFFKVSVVNKGRHSVSGFMMNVGDNQNKIPTIGLFQDGQKDKVIQNKGRYVFKGTSKLEPLKPNDKKDALFEISGISNIQTLKLQSFNFPLDKETEEIILCADNLVTLTESGGFDGCSLIGTPESLQDC